MCVAALCVASTGSCTCSDGAYKCVVCMLALLLVRTWREPWCTKDDFCVPAIIGDWELSIEMECVGRYRHAWIIVNSVNLSL